MLVICGPSEREAAKRIVGLRGPRASFQSGRIKPLSLGLSKACVKRSAVMVTTDSGPRHFAAAFGVPVVSLFGPTHIAWTRTYHPQAIHLQQPVSCGPCQKPVCPEGHHRCMRELDPETVFRATLRFLPANRNEPANSTRAAAWRGTADLMLTWLVTGAGGFLGSHVLETLMRKRIRADHVWSAGPRPGWV